LGILSGDSAPDNVVLIAGMERNSQGTTRLLGDRVMRSRVGVYTRTFASVSKSTRAVIPSPIKRLVKGLFAPYLRYRLSAIKPSQRAEADWAFFKKISSTAQPLSGGSPRVRECSASSVASGSEAGCHGVRLVGPADRGAATPMNIVIVSYHTYNNNSALHITGFANALTALGHRVVVSALGPVSDAGDFGVPRFRCIPHQLVRKNPELLGNYFAGLGSGVPDLIHCWTPREAVRSVARAIMKRYGSPYIVHLEDNEATLASIGATLEAPEMIGEFVAGAAGATIIVDALKDILPEGLVAHLLEPGVDSDMFAPNLGDFDRKRLCDSLNVPADAWMTVYPGTGHPATADDIFSLYTAIDALNVLGYKVHLIRTGVDCTPEIDAQFSRFSRDHVTYLGFVQRNWLVEILKLADFFVQPGGPDAFNNYRLPSKIPEFLATGRPLVLPRCNVGLLMEDGVNALIMQRGDAAEITQCVEKLLADPALAGRLGQEGRRFAIEHFNWQRSTEQLEGFYRDVLARARQVWPTPTVSLVKS
jgi:glycosyltransferase involved in cell wall biosynthesis